MKEQKIAFRKILSLLLVALLTVGIIPLNVFATDEKLKTGINLPVELNEQFVSSGLGPSGIDDSIARVETTDGVQYLKIGDRSNQTPGAPEQQQGGSLTSKYEIDFNHSFEMQGNLKMDTAPDGFTLSFHNNKSWRTEDAGGKLGYIDFLPNALVMEIDTHKNDEIWCGDIGKSSPHMVTNITGSSGEIKRELVYRPIQWSDIVWSGTGVKYSVKWDAGNKSMTFIYGNKSMVFNISENELINMFGTDKSAYMSLTGSTNFARPNSNEIWINLASVRYTDLDMQVETKYFVTRNGREEEVTISSQIKEEEVVTARHKYYNNTNSNGFFNMKTQLNDLNLFGTGNRVVQGSVAETKPRWYTPYIQDGSFNSTYQDGTSSGIKKEFLQGTEVDIQIPENQKSNTIEYKVVMPKVLGADSRNLSYDVRLGTTGMNYIQFNGLREVTGLPAVDIRDTNLKKGLIENVTTHMLNENRPAYPNVYKKELEALVTLNLSNKGITQLAGIENCKNVTTIDLSSNNGITVIRELGIALMPSLRSVSLANNKKIGSYSPLSQVETLIAYNSDITDTILAEIALLDKIKYLDLNNNKISDASLLKDKTSLTSLHLDTNNISDISSLNEVLKDIPTNQYSILHQIINKDKISISTINFEYDNIVKNKDGIESDISFGNNKYSPSYNKTTNKIKWVNLPENTPTSLSYNWGAKNSGTTKYSGVVNLGVVKTTCEVDNNKVVVENKANGSTQVIPQDGKMNEETRITVYEEYSNTVNSSNEYEKLIKNPKLSYIDSAGNVVNYSSIVKAGSTPDFYKPYFVSGSAKMFNGAYNTSNPAETDLGDDYFNGVEKNIKIPKNSGKITVKYDIMLPKVIGYQNTVKSEIKFDSSISALGSNFEVKSATREIVGNEKVDITDNNLNNTLLDIVKGDSNLVGRPNFYGARLYAKELEILTTLDLVNKNIANLDGIQYCINAEFVNLASSDVNRNTFSDITHLKDLPKLKELLLSGNSQAKASFSLFKQNSNFRSLKILHLWNCDLYNEDLSNFANLNLESINLNNNHISDTTSIKTLLNKVISYTILDQTITINPSYVNSGDFITNSVAKDKNGNLVNINGASNGGSFTGTKVTWTGLTSGQNVLTYNWNSTSEDYSGKVTLTVNQVQDPSFMVLIPSKLELGDVQDENSPDYTAERDEGALEFNPSYNPSVDGVNPTILDSVGYKGFISIVSNHQIEGKINIYTNPTFKISDVNDANDIGTVDVYKTFNDKIQDMAANKTDKLLSLDNNSKKGVFRIKAPKTEFKTNFTTYKGTITFVIDYVNTRTVTN